MKAIIEKENETSVSINGVIVELKNPIAGTDYIVTCNDKDEYNVVIHDTKLSVDEKIIGGFHYGLIPHDFMARNNIFQDEAEMMRGINAYSIWDTEHRPTCKPNGMAYIPKENIWVDIYMCGSEHEKYGTSAPHQHFLAGGNSNGRVNPKGNKDFLYKDFEKVAKLHGKRFITFDEFISSMKGVKEFDSAGDSDNGITKHHPDFVSRYGIEQATGHNWIWSEKIDNEKAVLLGGHHDDGVYSGSRCSGWSDCAWDSSWTVGCRFACDHLKLGE